MITINHLRAYKDKGEKFSCLTCYDATFASVISASKVDVMLVGDSLGNVVQGHDCTLPVTVQEICYHSRCVAKGNRHSLLMADLPFMSYANSEQACENAAALMRAGAHMVKMEGGAWLASTITTLTARGVPVCGHLGLTPQSLHSLGGYKVQAKELAAAEQLLADAKLLQQAGASMIVVECIPAPLAADLTRMLEIPVIGIGAGNGTDGQILVLHDILGLNSGYTPKFVKTFLDDKNSSVAAAITAYHTAVKSTAFPATEHSFFV